MTVECTVCGKETDNYHNFGTIELPTGDGEYKRTGYGTGIKNNDFIFDVPESRKDEYDNWMPTTEYIGSYEEIEYYECNECFQPEETE